MVFSQSWNTVPSGGTLCLWFPRPSSASWPPRSSSPSAPRDRTPRSWPSRSSGPTCSGTTRTACAGSSPMSPRSTVDGSTRVPRRRRERPRPGAVVVNGQPAFGQLAAGAAVRELVDVVAGHGSGVATIRDCNHVGRLGEYVAALAEHDLVALAFGNADPTVAPLRRPRTQARHQPARLGRAARRRASRRSSWTGRPPASRRASSPSRGTGANEWRRAWCSTRPAAPSTDPDDFYAGGALLPFGGHKGYGLSPSSSNSSAGCCPAPASAACPATAATSAPCWSRSTSTPSCRRRSSANRTEQFCRA